jgi:hypothetical protein
VLAKFVIHWIFHDTLVDNFGCTLLSTSTAHVRKILKNAWFAYNAWFFYLFLFVIRATAYQEAVVDAVENYEDTKENLIDDAYDLMDTVQTRVQGLPSVISVRFLAFPFAVLQSLFLSWQSTPTK